MTNINGVINEVRKTFTGDGTTGVVEFGRTVSIDRPGVHGNRLSATMVRVDLADGRKAYGRYLNPKDVRLTLKAGFERARKVRK